MFDGTDLTVLYLDQYPHNVLKNKIGNFDEADLQKAYARAQGKDDEMVTIVSRSRQIGRKLQAQTGIAPPPCLNIAPSEDPSITLGLTQEAVEYENISLMGGASLAFDPAGYDISLLGNKTYLIVNDIYTPEGVSI